ncbi:hypothetical protein [Streptomyces sp. TLI_105]|uniref:hypothetical protein n=1 Tax=Streptomyces sp. TLI_105 TaxID=1881019 RepID=UPI000897DDBC|nr:hypothetical protein [Streptomyces sp. TLI_105]SEE02503.1 hypothetical protein SAMN05428939_7084 [Streptomyces sp. TLI_105]
MTAHRRRGGGRAVHACFSVREAPGVSVTVAHDGTDLVVTARRTAQRALAEAGRSYLGGRVELRTPRPPAQVASRPSAFGPRRRRAVRRATDRAVALAVAAGLRGDPTDVRVPVRPPL